MSTLKVKLLVTESYPILCESMDYPVRQGPLSRDTLGKNTGVVCHFLLQGIFPTQGLSPGLPHSRQILYHLSYQGSPLAGLIFLKQHSESQEPGQVYIDTEINCLEK